MGIRNNLLILFLSTSCLDMGSAAAIHPPVEIIIDLKNMKVMSIDIYCDMPEISEFITQIKNKHGAIYCGNQTDKNKKIDSLNIKDIKDKYPSMME